MEIRQYILLLRKWTWFLVLGMVLGGIGGYVFSLYQRTIYETKTRVMVSRALQEDKSGYYVYTDIQLAKTYAQLVTAEPVLQLLSERLGFSVDREKISVEQIPDSLLLEVLVQDGDPQQAALIANTLVQVFIEYNDALQARRYEASEQSLKTQISQVESQIASLQADMEEVSAQTLVTQQQQVEERVQEIEKQLKNTESEIISLEGEIAAFYPTPPGVSTPLPPGTEPTATPIPLPTPTLSAVAAVKLKELELRLDQLNQLRDLYKQVYTNLLVVGSDSNSAESRFARQNQIQTALALYQQIYSNLLSNYENVRLARLNNTPNVAQVEPASPPKRPIQPQPLRSMMLGALSGLFLTAAFAFLNEYLNDTLKTPEDVLQYLNLSVIGMIGEMEEGKGKKTNQEPSVFVAENPLSPVTESFRTLRTNLDFASVDQPIRALLITSTSPSEGKSTVAVNLSAVMAQGGKKVVLVDTDLRRPSIHTYLHLPNRKGLSDLFRNQTRLANTILTWGTPPIAVLTSGALPPNPTELLASKEMGRIINDLKDKSDIVIVDSPPAIVADPVALSAKVDGVLLVIEPGKTRIDAAQVVLEQFQRAGARVVGVVLNPISRKRAHYYTKYQYYSSYYYTRGYSRYFGGNGTFKGKRKGKAKHQQEEAHETPVEQTPLEP